MTDTREAFCRRCGQTWMHQVTQSGSVTLLDCMRCGNTVAIEPTRPEPVRRSGALDREPKAARPRVVRMETMEGVVWIDPATGERINP